MPKIIADTKNKILESCRNQLFTSGYASVSIRSIAKDCQLSSGTIYNYFSSKDELIATIMLKDWIELLSQMDQKIDSVRSLNEGLMIMYQSLKSFCEMYKELFQQAQNSMHTIQSYHGMLLKQLTNRMNSLFKRFNQSEDQDLSTLIAEMILICSTKDSIDKVQVEKMIHRLVRKEMMYEQL